MGPALQKFQKLNVLLAVPSTGVWTEEFGKSLANMQQFFLQNKVGNYRGQQLVTMSIKGSILPNMRLSALKKAKEIDATHLLFVDSDQSFPRWTLHRLILRHLDVVGANIATKTVPTLPTARMLSRVETGELVYTEAESQGVQRVDMLGCGLILLSRKAVHMLPHDCFAMVYKPEVDKYQGEDWTMCEHLRAQGFEIYIDHEVSNAVGHHGTFNYTHEFNGTVVHKKVA